MKGLSVAVVVLIFSAVAAVQTFAQKPADEGAMKSSPVGTVLRVSPLFETQDDGGQALRPGEDLTGKAVFGIDGRRIGEVADVVTDPEGRVRRVSIEFGGFLGLGTRKAELPGAKVHASGNLVLVEYTEREITEMAQDESSG